MVLFPGIDSPEYRDFFTRLENGEIKGTSNDTHIFSNKVTLTKESKVTQDAIRNFTSNSIATFLSKIDNFMSFSIEGLSKESKDYFDSVSEEYKKIMMKLEIFNLKLYY